MAQNLVYSKLPRTQSVLAFIRVKMIQKILNKSLHMLSTKFSFKGVALRDNCPSLGSALQVPSIALQIHELAKFL